MSGTFVGVVKVHRIQADDGDFIGNNFHCIVRAALEDLQVREGDE